MFRHCYPARPEDFTAIDQTLELCQYERSDIWDQELDSAGRFGYDISKHRQARRFFAHIPRVDQHYAGLSDR